MASAITAAVTTYFMLCSFVDVRAKPRQPAPTSSLPIGDRPRPDARVSSRRTGQLHPHGVTRHLRGRSTLGQVSPSHPESGGRPRVLVLGGGFGGIGAAKKLAKAPVDVVLIDRHDYHTFQPLLY